MRDIVSGIWRAVVALIACSLICCATASAWEGYVMRVPDGDSLEIEKDGRLHRVRLYGVDSPEYGQPYWREARSFTSSMVRGKRVSIDAVDTDQYGRIVGLVRVQGRLVNSDSVGEGLAWVYVQYCQRQPLCRDLEALEQAARKQKLGLWHEKYPTPPWLWRHRQ